MLDNTAGEGEAASSQVKEQIEHANDLAWYLATAEHPDARAPAAARRLAQHVVQLAPAEGAYWNTLGVANFRTGEFPAAVDALKRSMELRQGGDSFDWFFLAMAYYQLGRESKARRWFERAVEWMQRNERHDEGLTRFRNEANALMGIEHAKPKQKSRPSVRRLATPVVAPTPVPKD